MAQGDVGVEGLKRLARDGRGGVPVQPGFERPALVAVPVVRHDRIDHDVERDGAQVRLRVLRAALAPALPFFPRYARLPRISLPGGGNGGTAERAAGLRDQLPLGGVHVAPTARLFCAFPLVPAPPADFGWEGHARASPPQ